MRKHNKFLFLLLIFLLAAVSGITVSAENTRKVVDQADLLSEAEEQELQTQLSRTAEKYQCDVAVVTVDSCSGEDIQTYTDDYYYENGYGYGSQIDGIMLLIAMEERQFHLSTRGEALRIFTDYGLERMDDSITPYLSDGAYYKAFRKFGSLAEEYMEIYEEEGRGYDRGSAGGEKLSVSTRFLIAAGAGLLIALIVVGILLAQLRSVGVEKHAREYVRQGSFHLTRSRDIFLYHTVHKRAKPKNNGGGGGSSSHRTSGGGRAGGRTGSF